MMLLHYTASSSTFGAHPHHSERLPNLNLMVRAHPKNLMNRMLPWMVRTPPPLDIYMLYINQFAVYNPDSIQTARNSCETPFLVVFWVPIVPFCEGPIGG